MPQALSLKARAVALLSRREHSRLELSRKLAPHSEDTDALERLLDDLVREGWLSDERFAQSLLHRRSATRGTARILNELRQSGVPDAAIAQARDELQGTEFERAQAVWKKKFGTLASSVACDAHESPDLGDSAAQAQSRRAAYARQARFLASRGFGHDVIARVLDQRMDDYDVD